MLLATIVALLFGAMLFALPDGFIALLVIGLLLWVIH